MSLSCGTTPLDTYRQKFKLQVTLDTALMKCEFKISVGVQNNEIYDTACIFANLQKHVTYLNSILF